MDDFTEAVEDAKVFLPQLPHRPYPGLRPFQKSEWPIFFGREQMADDVITLLMKHRLLVVHGTSGNGKSSLIRAGVLARLEQEHARSGIRWRTCTTNPGKNPAGNLAEALAASANDQKRDAIDFRRALNRGRKSARAVCDLLELNGQNRLCILIDQFEEIFHDFGDTGRDRSTLLSEFIVGFGEDPPEGLFVLLTMRSDFLGLCSQLPGLAEVINHSQYLLPRMDTDNLLRAVREPALLYGGTVREPLAERLIIDARTSQDELPLIQHGLSLLWESGLDSGATAPVLDLESYESARSLSQMISDHADRVAEEVAEGPAEKRMIEEMFRALTTINSEGQAVRRPQSLAQLATITGATEARLGQIIDAFRQPGTSFLTPYPPAVIGTDTTIDISHEALIRHWSKIADRSTGWLQKEFRDGLIWQALRVQAESFLSDPRNLLTEVTTEARSKWLKDRNPDWAVRYGGMWDDVVNLLDASRAEIDRQKQEDNDRKEHEDRLREQLERGARIRNYFLAAVVVAVGMSALTALAISGWRSATYQATVAEVAQKKAEEEKQRAETERSNAVEARNQEEVARKKAEEEQHKAETERLRADAARGEAVEAQQKAEAEKQRAETEKSNAEAARNQEEVARKKAQEEQQKAETERSRANAARLEAIEARQKAEEEKQRAETEARNAETARLEAVAAQQRTETERKRAEAEMAKAVQASNEAEAARREALEEAKKAQAEKAGADIARQQAELVLETAISERNRASRLQDESAAVHVTRYGRTRDTLTKALASLETETDAAKIAFFGQVVGRLSMLASASEIQSAIQILIRDLERTQDPSSASAIAQALSGVAANLNPEQAQLVVGTLLKSAPGDASGSRINALALVFGAVAPNVNQDSAAAMNAFLVRALATARDPELAARIGVALSSLKWAPTATQSELLVGPVVDVLSRARDPVHLGDIATIIIALAPTLQRKTAQNAIEEIRPIVPRAPAILNPALSALTKRVDQTGSEVPPAAQQPANLLQRVSASRWCTSSRSYSLQLVGNTATWRDNLGSVDTETVVLNNASDAQTVTQRSVHTDGNSEPIGTTWNYHMTGIDTVSVKSGNKKSFTLKRC